MSPNILLSSHDRCVTYKASDLRVMLNSSIKIPESEKEHSDELSIELAVKPRLSSQ